MLLMAKVVNVFGSAVGSWFLEITHELLRHLVVRWSQYDRRNMLLLCVYKHTGILGYI